MTTERAIEVIEKYQAYLKAPIKKECNVFAEDMPDGIEISEALDKAVEVMELMEKFNIQPKR